ncbi:MAG: DUF2185 domain-containing protein [Ruminococcus sp.]|nr:DUF2185 domain-containing protein [Ruminococcus sp.]
MDYRKLWNDNLAFISGSSLDPVKIAGLFTDTDSRAHLTIGIVDVPSGKVRVGDPLAYMCTGSASPVCGAEIAPGAYPAELSVVYTPFDTVRITSSRLKVKDTEAVRYEVASAAPGTEAFRSSDGCFAAFPVETGTMAFADAGVSEDYIRFIREWHAAHPDGNHYDDYFAELFMRSSMELPDYQRADGDFIEWTVPGSGRMVMNATGFGDGMYQLFCGYDSAGEICELIVPLVDPEVMENAGKEFLAVWDGVEACIVSNHVAQDGDIACMIRYEAESDPPKYNGWIFYGFDEDQDYWDDSDNFRLYSTHQLADRFPAIIPLLHSPVGAGFRADGNGGFEPLPDE